MRFSVRFLTTLAATVASLAIALQSNATVYTWTGSGTTNQWTNTSYWNGGSVAEISGSYSADRLTVNGSATLIYGTAQGYTIYGGTDTLAYGRSLTIANNAVGSMSITGGTWSSTGAGQDFIANGGFVGSLSIDGGVYLNTAGLYVSYGGGTGTFTVNSGLASVSNLIFGSGNTSVGVGAINLNGGTLSVGGISDASGSLTSTLNLNGGVLSARNSSTTISGLDYAYIQSLGAIVDSGTNTMKMNQSLLASTSSPGGGLTKVGTGTLVLSAANTYTGLTTVSAGYLNIQNGSALGTIAGSTTVASGATLQLQGGITVAGEALYINGSGAGGNNGALESVSSNNTWTGGITMDGTATNRIVSDADTFTVQGNIVINGAGDWACTLQGNGTLIVSGNITGGSNSGSLLVCKSGLGTGTAILTGNNNWIGNTGINGGTLQVGNGGTSGNICGNAVLGGAGTATLAFDRFDNITYSGAISGAGNVAQLGTGVLTLGAANSYSGTTIVNAGTLAVANTGSIGTSALSLGGASVAAAVFDVSAKAADFNVNGASGVGTIILASGKTLTLSSAINHTGTDNIVISGGLTLASGVSSTYEINLASDAYDYTSVLGTLNYNSTTLTIAFSGTKTATGTYTYDILDFASLSGTAAVAFSGLVDGESAVYNATTGIVTLTVVPEPGTLAGLFAAAMGLIAYAWRKRRK